MQAALHPMKPGEILDRTFPIYRKGFWPFIGLAALLATAIYGMAIPFESPCRHSPTRYWNFYTSVGYYDVYMLLLLAAFAAFAQMTTAAYLGDRVTARTALHSVLADWRRYLSA